MINLCFNRRYPFHILYYTHLMCLAFKSLPSRVLNAEMVNTFQTGISSHSLFINLLSTRTLRVNPCTFIKQICSTFVHMFICLISCWCCRPDLFNEPFKARSFLPYPFHMLVDCTCGTVLSIRNRLITSSSTAHSEK